MKRPGMILGAVVVVGAVGVLALHAARADTAPLPSRTLEARVAKLEQQVATLETQNAALRSVIQIESLSGTVTINPSTTLKLKSARIDLESTSTTEIKASGTVTLKGALINLN